MITSYALINLFRYHYKVDNIRCITLDGGFDTYNLHILINIEIILKILTIGHFASHTTRQLAVVFYHWHMQPTSQPVLTAAIEWDRNFRNRGKLRCAVISHGAMT